MRQRKTAKKTKKAEREERARSGMMGVDTGFSLQDMELLDETMRHMAERGLREDDLLEQIRIFLGDED